MSLANDSSDMGSGLRSHGLTCPIRDRWGPERAYPSLGYGWHQHRGSVRIGPAGRTLGALTQRTSTCWSVSRAARRFHNLLSFALDTLRLWEQGQTVIAVGTGLITVIGGLSAAVIGLMVGRSFA